MGAVTKRAARRIETIRDTSGRQDRISGAVAKIRSAAPTVRAMRFLKAGATGSVRPH